MHENKDAVSPSSSTPAVYSGADADLTRNCIWLDDSDGSLSDSVSHRVILKAGSKDSSLQYEGRTYSSHCSRLKKTLLGKFGSSWYMKGWICPIQFYSVPTFSPNVLIVSAIKSWLSFLKGAGKCVQICMFSQR